MALSDDVTQLGNLAATDKPAGPARKGERRYVGIGKYEIVKHIATGGMGAVYKAVDTESGRVVALKVLPPELAVKAGIVDRFRREADIGIRLRHEHLVTLLEFGEAAGTYYLALDFIEGTDLFEYIKQHGPLAPAAALRLVVHVAEALHYIHQQGVIHRDIKPSNLLISMREGEPSAKLTDLGLAIVVRDDEFRLTRAGHTVGTVDYMAPEQARDSRAADIRSDLYSLGCTWFHMLTGRPPFADGSLSERVYQHSEAPPPDVRKYNPEVPSGHVRILERMLAKRPDDRYQTPAQLLADLVFGDVPPEPLTNPTLRVMTPTPPARTPLAPPPRPESPGRRERRRQDRTPAVAVEAEPDPSSGSEHGRVAAGQFERATQVLATGNYDYGTTLLLSCCKLDPGNLTYRQALRQAVEARSNTSSLGKVFNWLRNMGSRTHLEAARRRGEHNKVLEYGEALLLHQPRNIPVQLDMASAAEALGLMHLAVWILEEAHQKNPSDVRVNRTLARLYEQEGNFTSAIALWELVRDLDVTDIEAHDKTRDLAARETIRRGQYETAVERRQGAGPS